MDNISDFPVNMTLPNSSVTVVLCVSEKALKEIINLDGKEMRVYEALGGNKNKLNRLIDNYSENGLFNLKIKDQEICEYMIKLGNQELQRAFQINNKDKSEGIE